MCCHLISFLFIMQQSIKFNIECYKRLLYQSYKYKHIKTYCLHIDQLVSRCLWHCPMDWQKSAIQFIFWNYCIIWLSNVPLVVSGKFKGHSWSKWFMEIETDCKKLIMMCACLLWPGKRLRVTHWAYLWMCMSGRRRRSDL